MPRKRSSPAAAAAALEESDVEDDEILRRDDDDDEDMDATNTEIQMFTSQRPELTQEIAQVKAHERNKLSEMSENQREKMICDLTRLVLFKALAGDAIDKTKCIKEANITDSRVSSAVFDAVQKRLNDCFGFTLKRLPEWMESIKGVSKVQKERYYVINGLTQADGSHSRALHMVHEQPSIEKGFLMIVLGFIYCKGDPRNDGSRWLLDKELYALLHRLDENMPAEPPTTTASSKQRSNNKGMSSSSQSRFAGGVGAAQTPDVDFLLHKFCQRDYLIREKPSEQQLQHHQLQGGDGGGNANFDEDSCFYTMGPRAAIEIGRRQVIYFCGEILDEEPDPTMLQELDAVYDDNDGGVAVEMEQQ